MLSHWTKNCNSPNCLSTNMLCTGLLFPSVCLNSFLPFFCWYQVHSFTRHNNVSKSVHARVDVCKLYVCLQVTPQTNKTSSPQTLSLLFLLCPGVLRRLEPAPVEPVRSDTARLHQPPTRISLSFGSHAFTVGLGQTVGHRYSLLYLCHVIISAWLLYIRASLRRMVCMWELVIETWKHMQD